MEFEFQNGKLFGFTQTYITNVSAKFLRWKIQ